MCVHHSIKEESQYNHQDGAIVITKVTIDGNCELEIGSAIFNRVCFLYSIVNNDIFNYGAAANILYKDKEFFKKY